MKTLGIITARGGSKGIPRKNLVPVNGKPLLWYTINVALASRLERVVMSTDDSEIASAAEAMGVEVPFMRPEALARDNTPTLPVLQDVVRKLEKDGCVYDAVFTLQPTNPLRLVSDINGAMELLETSGADSVIGFSDVGERHPARMKMIDAEGHVFDPPFAEKSEGLRRQDLEKYYLRDGSVYLTRRSVLMDTDSIKGDDCRAWIIPAERALNIDEPFDIFLCEKLLQYSESKHQ